MNNGELTLARELAEQFRRLALESADPSDRHIGDRMLGASLHLLGDQLAAREHVERMCTRYVASPLRSDVIRYQFDQPITAKITLARILWLQGFADQALHTVDSSIAEALSLGNTLTLCNTLAQGACPVALLLGDQERAERFTTMLLQQTERHALDIWHLYAVCYRGQLLIRRGDFETGLSIVRPAVEQLGRGQFVQYYTTFLMALAEGLTGAGQTAEAFGVIDEALTRSEQSCERWCTPEMLRMKGEVVLRLSGVQGTETAERHFIASLELARQQQALAWELRTATSLARLRCNQDRAAEAHDLLAPVFEHFSEGFDTADLRMAKLLLDDIS